MPQAQMRTTMTTKDFLSLDWGEIEGPLIEPPRFSPVIADPSFLFPEETPTERRGDVGARAGAGGEWELFAHSAWGIHRYSSPDGLSWKDRGLVVRNAMRPFVRRLPPGASAARQGTGPEGVRELTETGGPPPRTGAAEFGPYALYFESYAPFALPLSVLPFKRPWNSRIAVSRSADLDAWTRPETLLEPNLPWMRDPKLGASVSNPCLVWEGSGRGAKGGSRVAAGDPAEGAWRLYFSASLSWLPDCGFCEPRYLALAEGSSPLGPFVAGPKPILDPAADPLPGVLGAGSMKVLAFEDGWIGLQNKIYRDPRGKSRSAIFLLRSEDGLAWEPAREEPLLAPGAGWTSSHVYACDCRLRESEGLWYLYFNARDGWKISEGKERIGRIVGKAP